MREFTFESNLWLPRPRAEIFPFFADPHNLEIITPPWLNFKMLTRVPLKMQAGVLIEYKLMVHRVAFRWRSEITLWEPPYRFVDEQRRGPYRRWIHEHRFEESAGGTNCKDIVRYSLPFGWLLERLFVRRDLKRIFAFRAAMLTQIFPKESPHLIQKDATNEDIKGPGDISLCE